VTLLIREILGDAEQPDFAGRRRDSLAVDSEAAQRRRLRGATTGGTSIAIDLPRGSFLRQHAVLHDDGERIIVVERTPEPALVVCLDPSFPPQKLVGQAARVGHWAGNQHLLVETEGHEIHVRITTTPELMLRAAETLELPGAQVTFAELTFALERPVSVPHAHG
jgi:urease accessory protein